MELDIEFVERLRQKDEGAIKIFLNEFKVPLYNYIYRMVYSKEDAEDILQESFLKIFKNIKKIDFSKNYKSFIYQITRNLTLDFLKKRRNKYELDEELMGTGDESYEKMEARDRIEKMLQGITREEREIVILKYIENFKILEISKILQIPESTVKVRIFRTIRKMREYVQDKRGTL